MSTFVWYELMTGDADGSAAFYSALMGWTIAGGTPGQTGAAGYRHITRSDGGGTGGLLPLSADMLAQGARPCWVGYLYVADVDAAIAAIVADGGRVLMPGVDIAEGRFAMVTDPQGVAFYIMTPTPPAGQPKSKSDAYDRQAPQRVAWNELYTTDLDAAKVFYARHFGFAFKRAMPMGPEFGDYCFIDDGGEEIGAMMKRPPHVPRAGWNFYFRVADIAQAQATIESHGGRVLNGPMEVPGGDWIINGLDPQGATFAVVGARSAS